MKRKWLPPLAGLAIAILPANSGAASAQTIYPWCLIEATRGVWICSYVSFEHCLAFRVATEMCNIPRYQFAAAQPRKVKRARPR